MRWKDLKMSKKVALGFMVPVFLMAGIGVWTYQVSKRVSVDTTMAREESIMFLLKGQQMEKDVIQVQQLFTDILATRVQDGSNGSFDEAEKRRQSFLSEMEHFRKMYGREKKDAALEKLNDLESLFDAYYNTGKNMAQAYIDGDPSTGNRMILKFDEKAEALQAVLQPLLKDQVKETNILLEDIVKAVNSLKKGVAELSIFAAIFIFLVGFFLNRSVSGPVKELVTVARSFGDGDFSIRMDESRKDEFGELASYFNEASHKIGSTIQRVKGATHDLASSSEELSSSAAQIAQGSEEQSAKASQVATASQEMSATIVDVAKNVAGAAEAAGEANKVALNGGGIVEKTIESIKGIADTTRGTSRVITALGERSQDVGKIISVINEIASQTNLLALNAAIEAARAGEQGRGFAVVADEVRKLAEKTTGATKEIEEMIKMIQDDTEKALSSMESEVKAVEEGVKLTMDADTALKEIVAEVEKVSSMVQQIAAAADEQSTASDQISGDIESVAEITEESARGAQQIAAASEDIAQLASNLQSTVATFKISSEADMIAKKRSLPITRGEEAAAT
ncbi:MAG TPA: methyl-accepting chemotaxis protein [Nitrospirae bacterium]|nr:methyl-accepting chemotaxis protein CtpH [bacterium BMS3Abin06]HDH11588.1 methyl-accepting chemotaxis protein [Nitrospirota bacterium]HDZ01955.1 methyl-accepting chemotaxis protein [Nitrospirota bacterium]